MVAGAKPAVESTEASDDGEKPAVKETGDACRADAGLSTKKANEDIKDMTGNTGKDSMTTAESTINGFMSRLSKGLKQLGVLSEEGQEGEKGEKGSKGTKSDCADQSKEKKPGSDDGSPKLDPKQQETADKFIKSGGIDKAMKDHKLVFQENETAENSPERKAQDAQNQADAEKAVELAASGDHAALAKFLGERANKLKGSLPKEYKAGHVAGDLAVNDPVTHAVEGYYRSIGMGNSRVSYGAQGDDVSVAVTVTGKGEQGKNATAIFGAARSESGEVKVTASKLGETVVDENNGPPDAGSEQGKKIAAEFKKITGASQDRELAKDKEPQKKPIIEDQARKEQSKSLRSSDVSDDQTKKTGAEKLESNEAAGERNSTGKRKESVDRFLSYPHRQESFQKLSKEDQIAATKLLDHAANGDPGEVARLLGERADAMTAAHGGAQEAAKAMEKDPVKDLVKDYYEKELKVESAELSFTPNRSGKVQVGLDLEFAKTQAKDGKEEPGTKASYTANNRSDGKVEISGTGVDTPEDANSTEGASFELQVQVELATKKAVESANKRADADSEAFAKSVTEVNKKSAAREGSVADISQSEEFKSLSPEDQAAARRILVEASEGKASKVARLLRERAGNIPSSDAVDAAHIMNADPVKDIVKKYYEDQGIKADISFKGEPELSAEMSLTLPGKDKPITVSRTRNHTEARDEQGKAIDEGMLNHIVGKATDQALAEKSKTAGGKESADKKDAVPKPEESYKAAILKTVDQFTDTIASWIGSGKPAEKAQPGAPANDSTGQQETREPVKGTPDAEVRKGERVGERRSDATDQQVDPKDQEFAENLAKAHAKTYVTELADQNEKKVTQKYQVDSLINPSAAYSMRSEVDSYNKALKPVQESIEQGSTALIDGNIEQLEASLKKGGVAASIAIKSFYDKHVKPMDAETTFDRDHNKVHLGQSGETQLLLSRNPDKSWSVSAVNPDGSQITDRSQVAKVARNIFSPTKIAESSSKRVQAWANNPLAYSY